MVMAEAKAPSEQIAILKSDDRYQLLLNDQREDIIKNNFDDILLNAEHEIVTRFIRAFPALLWFHAGAAAHQQSAILFVGESGQGKSALVTTLCQKGWMYLSDEVIPVNPKSGELFPFPQMPKVRKPSDLEISRDEARAIEKTELSVPFDDIVCTTLPIEMIIFPTYLHHGATRLEPSSPATAVLELVANCLNFNRHGSFALGYLSDLVERVPAFRLQYNNRELAVELIQQEFFQHPDLMVRDE
jgi:hypothetical protein